MKIRPPLRSTVNCKKLTIYGNLRLEGDQHLRRNLNPSILIRQNLDFKKLKKCARHWACTHVQNRWLFRQLNHKWMGEYDHGTQSHTAKPYSCLRVWFIVSRQTDVMAWKIRLLNNFSVRDFEFSKYVRMHGINCPTEYKIFKRIDLGIVNSRP